MKILILASYKHSLLKFRGDLIRELVLQGHEVVVAAPSLRPGDQVWADLRNLGCTCRSVVLDRSGHNPLLDMVALFSLFAAVVSERPDVVVAYTIKPIVYGLLAARLARVRCRIGLVTGLGGALGSGGKTSRALVFLHRVALRGAKAAIFQNVQDRDFFRARRVLSGQTASFVVNGSGVSLDEFKQSTPVSQPLRFLMIARLLASKGVREYASVARRVRRLFPAAEFQIAGWRENGPDFVTADELRQWESEGSLILLGKLDHVGKALRSCSVFVLPTYYPEGLPRSILEALAIGRAIVTTDMPGCRTTVEDGQNGFLVAPRSEDQLFEACLTFAKQPELIATMGLQSRILAESRFDVKKVNKEMIAIIESCSG